MFGDRASHFTENTKERSESISASTKQLRNLASTGLTTAMKPHQVSNFTVTVIAIIVYSIRFTLYSSGIED